MFKLFKSKAAGIKNVSKKTVTLLDGEDLDALMHLTEEFPEVSRSMGSVCSHDCRDNRTIKT